MPVVKRFRFGHPARGQSAANGSDNFRVVYVAGDRTELDSLTISVRGLTLGAAIAAGLARVVVWIGGNPDVGNSLPATSLTDTSDPNVPGKPVADSDIGITQGAGEPVRLPIPTIIVERGEVAVVEVSNAIDNTGAAAIALATVCLYGKKCPADMAVR